MSLTVPPTLSWLPVKCAPPETHTLPRARIGTDTVTPPLIVVQVDVLSDVQVVPDAVVGDGRRRRVGRDRRDRPVDAVHRRVGGDRPRAAAGVAHRRHLPRRGAASRLCRQRLQRRRRRNARRGVHGAFAVGERGLGECERGPCVGRLQRVPLVDRPGQDESGCRPREDEHHDQREHERDAALLACETADHEHAVVAVALNIVM